jgi:stage 0 sporulation protein B (sporulation initiation phosphotransferase)
VNGQKTVDLLREIRHDFGNHLQVIMGYLDLGNPQQARKYIIKLIEEMAAERLIFESTDADTALYLYQQLLLSRELGVITYASSNFLFCIIHYRHYRPSLKFPFQAGYP